MKIKVLLVIPGKEIQTVRIPASFKFIKSFIGENLYKVKLNEHTILIANQNAPIHEFNRFLNGKVLLGTFLIIGFKKHRIVSLKKRQVRKYRNMFSLRKHEKRIDRYKEEYLENFYCSQREMKQKNAEENKKQIFTLAA